MHKRMGTRGRGADGTLGIGRRALLALPFLAGLILLLAAPAQASFHLIKVREVFPGTAARPDSDYVELQMYAAGQNLVHFGHLEVLNSTGGVIGNFTPAGNVANAANQSTVLIADSEFAGQFPGLTADFEDSALNLSPSGGAVCWPQTEPPFDDCASWGNFSGKASLPSPGDSAAAAAIPDGMALRRSIAPGCATLLENGDDTDNSSVDFSLASPAPRGNATTPVEHECAVPPNTAIDAKPANPSKGTAASFTYHSVPVGAEFECSLDAAPFAACGSSGIEYPGPLGEGGHIFEVQAVGESGVDSTPASYFWTIDTTPPQVEIKTHPVDPSPGNSAAFAYSSKETGSTFQCSLEPAGEPDDFSACPATGKTYPDVEHPGPLADGEWTFKVAATDKAGNVGPAEGFSWEVSHELADETPPQTTIDSRPPDPSLSSSAAFAYSSNEAESSFQCQLDSAGFGACPASGIAYSGLGNGSHSFQVRAIDPSGNVDPSPAGYSFEVVLGSTVPVLSPPTPVPLPPPARPPNTAISGKGGTKTHDRTPTFRFGSGSAGATFQCKLDHGPFKACRSPLATKTLTYGGHLLQVRAILNGTTDPTPAKLAFKVVKP